jgi:hypothetical protein
LTDGFPSAGCDGCDAACLGKEGVPGLAAGIDDPVVAVEDAVGEISLAQELPDVLLWIEKLWGGGEGEAPSLLDAMDGAAPCLSGTT